MLSKIRKCIFIILAISISMFSLKSYMAVECIADGTIYLVPPVSETWYKLNGDNTCYTTINGVSNIYHNLQKDGYRIYKEEITKEFFDISFVKEGYPAYRIYFLYPSGYTYAFCENYENSPQVFSYIIER